MSSPVRMCIHCRKRFLQQDLIRLQCSGKKVVTFTGSGRSFYLCKTCIDDPKAMKSLARYCKLDKEGIERLGNTLKENAADG